MLNEKKKRLDYIDWAKAISIILIVAGHMLPKGCGPKTLAYAFHVPIFALIGGLLFSAPKSASDFGKKLFGIFKRMVVPYVIWFVVSAAFYWQSPDNMSVVVAELATKDWLEILKCFVFYNNITIWNDPLWFMPCYIFISCLFLVFITLARGSIIAAGALSVTSIGTLVVLERLGITVNAGDVKNVFGLKNYFLLLGFLAAGYALRPLLDKCAEFSENPRKNPFLYGAVLTFIVFSALCLMHNRVDANPGGYYVISMFSGRYNGVLAFFLFGLVLSVSLVIALMLLPKSRIANLLSRNSLFIMVSHYFFFFDITFYQFNGAAWRSFVTKADLQYWQWDMAVGFRDAVFIIVFYIILLFGVDLLLKRFPKIKTPFGFIGIQ